MKSILVWMMAVGIVAGGDLPFYRGEWKIESGAAAPWASGSKPDRALVGQTIAFGARSVTGPGVLGCKAPKYQVAKTPADGLFQGTLGGGTQAAQAAAKLGFADGQIETLYTGCEHAIDFHFFDRDSAAFALDNVIYRMGRRVASMK